MQAMFRLPSLSQGLGTVYAKARLLLLPQRQQMAEHLHISGEEMVLMCPAQHLQYGHLVW